MPNSSPAMLIRLRVRAVRRKRWESLSAANRLKNRRVLRLMKSDALNVLVCVRVIRAALSWLKR